MTRIKTPTPLFICKHPGILGAAATVAELLPQVQQGPSLTACKYCSTGTRREKTWRILLKLASQLQKGVFGDYKFLKGWKVKARKNWKDPGPTFGNSWE